MQTKKIPYLFPAERISCYSADLVLRQYSRVKGEYGQGFTYQNLRKVYTIVIFEKSSEELRTPDHRYLHNPGEVLNLHSEALRILDANTVQYMVDRQQEQIEQQAEQIDQQTVQIDQLTEKLAENDRIIEELTRQKH